MRPMPSIWPVEKHITSMEQEQMLSYNILHAHIHTHTHTHTTHPRTQGFRLCLMHSALALMETNGEIKHIGWDLQCLRSHLDGSNRPWSRLWDHWQGFCICHLENVSMWLILAVVAARRCDLLICGSLCVLLCLTPVLLLYSYSIFQPVYIFVTRRQIQRYREGYGQRAK